jgi:hypothetical protein
MPKAKRARPNPNAHWLLNFEEIKKPKVKNTNSYHPQCSRQNQMGTTVIGRDAAIKMGRSSGLITPVLAKEYPEYIVAVLESVPIEVIPPDKRL